jgi:crossover junction endodeoxyribonuclease RusA
MSEITLTLPWPPTVNSYWSHGIIGGKHKKARASLFLSDHGKAYRTHAHYAIKAQQIPMNALHGRLAVSAIAYPPDNRTRDVDNLWKGMLDALKNAGVIVDDGHIDDLHIRRGPVRAPEGCVVLKISEIADAFESRQAGLDLAPPPIPATSPPPF